MCGFSQTAVNGRQMFQHTSQTLSEEGVFVQTLVSVIVRPLIDITHDGGRIGGLDKGKNRTGSIREAPKL